MMGMLLVVVLLTLAPCIAEYSICPQQYATNIQTVLGLTDTRAWVQQGVYHRLPCTAFQSNERLQGVVWYKGNDIDAPGTVRLITHSAGTDLPARDRYAFSSDFSLVIKSVEATDEGRYHCVVIPTSAADRVAEMDVRVIGDSFPAKRSEISSSTSIQRGRRQTLSCQCAIQTLDASIAVVYWSTGEGIATDTEIIGARFSDGTVLQIQHGADYSVGSDASLTVNSLNDVQDTQRFWCHVFHHDGTLSNCYSDVRITGERSMYDTLRASATSVYLLKGRQQVVPCTSWTSDHATCEIHWLKMDPTSQLLLKYNVSDGNIQAESGFDLASDFGLLIKSVDDVHAGRYSCTTDSSSKGYIDARIIGYGFPLDDGRRVVGKTMNFEPRARLTLRCPAVSDVELTSGATLIWSFGARDAQTTTVIGTLNQPDGFKTMSDLGDSSCFGISFEGSLLMNNCSQDGDVRYWCHVFPFDDVLIRSYVDVSFKDDDSRKPRSIVLAIAVPVCVLALVLVVAVCLQVWRLRQRDVRGDQERCCYALIHRNEPFTETELAEQVRKFVSDTTSRLPITPWARREEDNAPIDAVYTPLELVVNVSIAGCYVRYTLESESKLFDDGISKLSSRHVLVQGRSGSGKTTFLYKMAHDWFIRRADALLGQTKMVLILPAGILIKTGKLGKAIARHYMLHNKAEQWANSICEYCIGNPEKVALLVDDCNNHDIYEVMDIVNKQGLSKCQVVMTTRQGQVASDACKTYNLRHVTITGFNPQNARAYIGRIKNTNQYKDTSSEERHGIASPGKKQENKDTVDNSSSSDHGNLQLTPTELNEQFQNIEHFLKSDTLPPKVACLPVNMAALCQLSIWSKGEAFKHDPTMGDLFTWLVRCLFDSGSSVGDVADKASSSLNQSDHATDLLNNQLKILAELGKVVLSKMIGCHGGTVALTKDDILNSSDNGQEVLDVGKKIGLIRYCKDPEPISMVNEGNNTDHISQSTEVHFTLEILRDFCAGIALVHNHEQDANGMVNIQLLNDKINIDEFSNVYAFACRRSQTVCSALVKNLIACRKVAARHKLGLLLNYEGKCEGSLNDNIVKLFDGRMVKLSGISGHMIGILSYLFKYARHQVANVNSNPKSVELFRSEKHDWVELRDYYDYFFPMVLKDNDMRTTNDLQSTGESGTSHRLHEMSESKDTNMAMIHSDHNPHAMKMSDIKGKHTETEINQSNDTRIEHCGVSEDEAVTLKQLRERIESNDINMPVFPPNQSDTSVLHTVQSLGLQELVELQSGECHSSTAANDLARCLTGLEKLESLVLVGTILSSEDLVDFAGKLNKLPKLRKLDLRLNTLFDDEAFVAITTALKQCNELNDLRLSLYKVTKDGFDRAKSNTAKDGARLWLRLKTLYLLHGQVPEFFQIFLKNSLVRKIQFTLRERQSYIEVLVGTNQSEAQ